MFSSAQTWAEQHVARNQPDAKTQGLSYAFNAVVCLISWFAIGIWLKKKKLNRTNEYGTEVHADTKTYFKSSALEGLASWAAVLLFAGGLFFVIAALVKCN